MSASGSPSTAPTAGMFLWGRLAGTVSARDVLTAALDEGVAFVPGDAFYTGPADLQSLRLSFATATPDELDEGARRLAAALTAVGSG